MTKDRHLHFVNAIEGTSSDLRNFARLIMNLKDLPGLDDPQDVLSVLADYAFRLHQDLEQAVRDDPGGAS